MSDDYHRPTLTFPDRAYNATQVRLYGFVPPLRPKGPGIKIGKPGITLQAFKGDEGNPKIVGFDLMQLDTRGFGTVAIFAYTEDKDKPISAGVIVGYAFEGHCYDLAKPKIMLIRTMPETEIPTDDCGYDEKVEKDPKKEDAGYKVWIVDKLSECVELEMNQGFVEQLVLEANLPGKRSPTMYAGRMMLAHRSGRLTE